MTDNIRKQFDRLTTLFGGQEQPQYTLVAVLTDAKTKKAETVFLNAGPAQIFDAQKQIAQAGIQLLEQMAGRAAEAQSKEGNVVDQVLGEGGGK